MQDTKSNELELEPTGKKAAPLPSPVWGVLGYIGLFLLGCTGIGLLFVVIPYLYRARVTIPDGWRGVSYNYGKLEILEPGVHWLMNIFNSLHSTVSVGQSIPLKIPRTNLRTADNIEVEINAEIIFKVTNVEQYVLTGFKIETLGDIAKGALCEAYQSFSLELSHHIEDDHDEHRHEKSKKMTVDDKSIHQENKRKIYEQLQKLVAYWGIEIVNFSLTGFDIVDLEVRKALAQPTILMRQAEAQRKTAEAAAQTAMIQAENNAETIRVQSRAEADRVCTMATAEAEAISTRAAGEATMIKALAHAAGGNHPEQLAYELALLARKADILKECKSVSLLNSTDIFSGNYNPTFLRLPKDSNTVAASSPLNRTSDPIIVNY